MNDHPDDDRLSAHIDHEGEDTFDAHLAECATCRRRVAELAAVSGALAAAPAPPPAAAVERAVAAALAAWDDERASDGAEVAGTAGGGADVLPLDAARGGRRGPSTWVLGLAAAVLAVLVAVPLLVAGRDGGAARDQVAATRAQERTEAELPDEAPARAGPDLGEQSDPAVLRRVVGVALAGADQAGTATAAAPPASDAGGEAPAQEPGGAERAAPAPTLDDAAVTRRCARSLRASSGARLGPLVYSATLRWQGTPAVVLAYQVPRDTGAALAHQVFVMSREDCRLLVFQGL